MRLYLLRHGKADKDSPTGRDEDRPLVDEGRDQARFIGAAFRSALTPLEIRPHFVLSSSAARARATAEIVAESLGLPVEFDPALFPDQSVRRALRLVTDLLRRPDRDTVVLVGHNPQFEDLLELLAGEAAPERLRTGELAALNVELRDGRPQGQFIASIRADDDD